MPLEILKPKIAASLEISWKMVYLVSRIERFDEIWPGISLKEKAIIRKWTIYEKLNIDGFRARLQDCPRSLFIFEELIFWYDTESEIHPLISCMLFAWNFQLIPDYNENKDGESFNIMSSILVRSGYTWAMYLPFNDSLKIRCSQGTKVDDWVLLALTYLNDGQEAMMHRIDLGILAWKQIATEELLLQIIEHNDGIRTTAIGRKLGTSTATVKRMLNRLIIKNIIERCGIGRATRYRIR
jgi:hypothetical protein